MGNRTFTVKHQPTGAHAAGPYELLSVAVAVAKSMGPDFHAVEQLAFTGIPAVAVVMRDDGQLEGAFYSRAVALKTAQWKNDHAPGRYEVKMVLINCES